MGFWRLLAAAGLAGVLAMPAFAAGEVYEIQASSNAADHPVGQKLAKGAKVNLPAGASISYIDRSGTGVGVLRSCSGRYQGEIEKCSAQGTGPGGGTAPGGTRGATR